MINYQNFSLLEREILFVQKNNNLETSSKALIFMLLEKMFPDADLDKCITDGGDDFCLDAYYIDEENKTINLFQSKHTGNFNTAKIKEGLKEKEISDFLVKIGLIWNKDKSIFRSTNAKFVQAVDDIYDAFKKGFTKTKIFFVSNYKTTINKTSRKSAEKFVEKNFSSTLTVLALDDLAEFLIKSDLPIVDIKLQLKGRNYFEESTGDVRALIGDINALTLLKSILNDEQNLREEIFNENIRVYLRSNTRVNEEILSSIKGHSNYKFFYYNNGITAICDSFAHNNSDSPIVSLKNFQIVNGGQTIHSIYEAYKNGLEKNIAKIYLLLRIYEVKNREVGQEIATFTNTQNIVRSRDIMSNDTIQIKLQRELMRIGFFYERKKYEFRDKNDVDTQKKIDAERLGQTLLAFYLEKPGSAKNKKQEIFGDFYKSIFDSSKISADYVLLPYLLFKKIILEVKKFEKTTKEYERDKKEKELQKLLDKDGFLSYAQYYLLFTLKLLSFKYNPVDKNVDKIFRLFPKAKDIIRNLVKKRRKDPKFSLPHLFKSDDLVNQIRTVCKITEF